MKYLFAFILCFVVVLGLYNINNNGKTVSTSETSQLEREISIEVSIEMLEGNIQVTILEVYENSEYKIKVRKGDKEEVMVIQLKNQ